MIWYRWQKLDNLALWSIRWNKKKLQVLIIWPPKLNREVSQALFFWVKKKHYHFWYLKTSIMHQLLFFKFLVKNKPLPQNLSDGPSNLNSWAKNLYNGYFIFLSSSAKKFLSHLRFSSILLSIFFEIFFFFKYDIRWHFIAYYNI